MFNFILFIYFVIFGYNVAKVCEKMPNPLGQSIVDCGSIASMPIISFTIGGKTFDLSSKEVHIFLLHTFNYLAWSISSSLYLDQ